MADSAPHCWNSALLKFRSLGWPPDSLFWNEICNLVFFFCFLVCAFFPNCYRLLRGSGIKEDLAFNAPYPLQATHGLATIPKCQQALFFQEDSHIFQLYRQFMLHCDSKLNDNGRASDLNDMNRDPDIALQCWGILLEFMLWRTANVHSVSILHKKTATVLIFLKYPMKHTNLSCNFISFYPLRKRILRNHPKISSFQRKMNLIWVTCRKIQ